MIPKESVALILESEGLDQPSKWPGGSSGITLGHGYDLGYYTAAEFERDWDGHLTPANIESLKAAIGVTGQAARRMAPRFRHITIHPEAAAEVFAAKTLPTFEKRTQEAFPRSQRLPPRAFGALVSLVFNRGGAMYGERRSEMRLIRSAIINHFANAEPNMQDLLDFIADQIVKMKRLWYGQGLDGLLRRRDREAKMVRTALA